ncbi:hypothetical protein ACKZDW_24225 [Ralstonia syzygii subsp. celebesensis]
MMAWQVGFLPAFGADAVSVLAVACAPSGAVCVVAARTRGSATSAASTIIAISVRAARRRNVEEVGESDGMRNRLQWLQGAVVRTAPVTGINGACARNLMECKRMT